MRRRFVVGVGLLAVGIALLVGGIIGLAHFITSAPDSQGGAPAGAVDDAFQAGAVWASNGTGLDLVVLNSCSDDWSAVFDTYIHAWDTGTPDALTLTVKKTTHDPDCHAYRGRVNVCNGDYGPTGWQGVAYIFGQDNTIMSSTALMNDFYLSGNGLNIKLYTMCHELGHAYGLPHTDTNHYNADLGDCMDYTTTYSNNLNPGQVNFDRLFSLYGAASSNTSVIEGNEQDGNNGGNRRLQTSSLVSDAAMMEKFNAIVKCMNTMSSWQCEEQLPFNIDRVQMLQDTKQEESVKMSLGNGFFVQMHTSLLSS